MSMRSAVLDPGDVDMGPALGDVDTGLALGEVDGGLDGFMGRGSTRGSGIGHGFSDCSRIQ